MNPQSDGIAQPTENWLAPNSGAYRVTHSSKIGGGASGLPNIGGGAFGDELYLRGAAQCFRGPSNSEERSWMTIGPWF